MNIMTILMNQLKMRNPQALKQFQSLRQSQNNPQEFLNQLTGKYTPEQRERFINYAKGFGISDEQLNKYGINARH